MQQPKGDAKCKITAFRELSRTSDASILLLSYFFSYPAGHPQPVAGHVCTGNEINAEPTKNKFTFEKWLQQQRQQQ
jgi:hypothetical protein